MLRELSLLFKKQAEFAWREVHWPSELPPELAASLLRQLGTDYFLRPLALEVEVRGGALLYRIGVPQPASGRIDQLLTALVPSSAVTPAHRDVKVPNAFRILLTSRQRPLQLADPERTARALLAALTAVREDERVVLQWILGRTHAPRSVSASERVSSETWWQPLLSGKREPDPEWRKSLEAKRGEHRFACVGRVAIDAKPGRTRALAVGVLAALRTAEAPGSGLKLVREPSERVNQAAVPWLWTQTLNVSELVGLLAWPLGGEPLPGLPREEAHWLRADRRIKPNGRVLGVSTAPGEQSRRLGLAIQDQRQHLHVIGPTGTGKSTLLGNLILQDIGAGRAVVVIEPKGDLVQDVLERIPPERNDDVVVLDPNELEHPVGLNPLLMRGRRPELVADQVLAVFHGLWHANWGPRLQDILHSALLTLAGRGDTSLCVLPALLTNEAVRRRLRAGVDDPIALEPFWAWFDSISDAERNQAIAPVLNKLRPFLLRKSVRAIVGQVKPRFRIDELFTKRRVVLVSLAKGRLGPEASALLGSLFVAELWQAILARGGIAPERRHPVVLYADEFQEYVHLPTDMADALAQARGLGVGLVLAHQHLAQLPAGLKASVLANARSRMCFQLSAEDAQTMARFAGGNLEPVDFQRLRRFQAYAQLVVENEVVDFASLRTLLLPSPTADAQEIRRLSRERYGRPLTEIEAEIRKLIEGAPEVDEPLGRRRRSEG